jgi:hypothetical protein
VKIVEDVRKTVGNPKPLYFAAGVGDAAVSALMDAPARLNDVSAKATDAATTLVTKVAGAAETVQSKIALGQLDPKSIRERIVEPDLRAVREKTQNLVLAQVGWALEVAGKAVETYDGYSERGKVVVDRVLSGRSGTDVVSVDDAVAAHDGQETVVVDEVVVIADVADAKDVKAAEPKPAETHAAPKAPAAPTAANGTAKPAAGTARKTSTSRKKTTPPKA